MKNKTIVYWTGNMASVGEKTGSNWNILYPDPQSLYKDLSFSLNKENSTPSFYHCPAFKSISQSTFVIKNPISSHYQILNNSDLIRIKNSSMTAEIIREPTLNNSPLVRYALPFLAFSEESVVMSVTPPYMHNAEHTRFGSVVPGKFDISKWFRPFFPEININSGIDEFFIPENDPFYYVSFETNKKIQLVKFEMNETLNEYAYTCSTAGTWEPKVSIEKRYERFISSKSNKSIIKQIKKNIID